MTQEQEIPAQEMDEARQTGPGWRLREAREANGLTTQQVAAQLRMQLRIIEALENDDYSNLPGTTFVQGYLRSYARLLGLPEEEILASAPRQGDAPELVGSIYDGKAEVTSRDLPFRLMTFLVLVAGIIGVGWWLSQQVPVTEPEAQQTASTNSEQGLALPTAGESQLEGDGNQGLPVTTGAEGGAGEGAATTADDGAVEPVTDEVASQPEQDSATEEQVGVAEITEPSATEVQPKPRPEAPTPPPLTPATPQSLLELEFQADCWSDITDAAGRKLAYGLIKAGEKLALHGEAPFKVFLGYANGVTVYYNGELYDHSPFQRGDVARFRVGQSEHNHPLSGN